MYKNGFTTDCRREIRYFRIYSIVCFVLALSISALIAWNVHYYTAAENIVTQIVFDVAVTYLVVIFTILAIMFNVLFYDIYLKFKALNECLR